MAVPSNLGIPPGSAWNIDSISPGTLPVPPGFLTPEEIMVKSKPISQSRFFSPEDFLTDPTVLSDPKLASRAFSSVPTNTPITTGASVSAFNNVQVPAFLTNAVNQLNQTQASQASMREGFRQQLLEAVLGGNFLAAEALRASVVTPGASVGFGGAVQNPQIGQAAVIGSLADTTQANAISDTLRGKPTTQQTILQRRLQESQQQLANAPKGFGFSGGEDRAALTSKQFQIRREIRNLQKSAPNLKFNLNNGFVPRTGLGV